MGLRGFHPFHSEDHLSTKKVQGFSTTSLRPLEFQGIVRQRQKLLNKTQKRETSSLGVVIGTFGSGQSYWHQMLCRNKPCNNSIKRFKGKWDSSKQLFLDKINSVLFVKMNSPSKRGEMNLLDYTQYEWDIIGIGSLTDSMELNLILH